MIRELRREAVRRAGVYLVTEESLSAGRSSEEIVDAALRAGVRIVQIREKDATSTRASEIAIAARRLSREYDALLIVNDRVDLALAVGADGVHVGQQDLPVSTVRRLLGPDAIIGLSITAAAQLGAADATEADYLGVGSVFPTESKADATLTGLQLVRAARTATGLPIVAIGGITLDNAAIVLDAGADTLAVISAISLAADPEAAAAALLEVVRVRARATARPAASSKATH